MKTRYRFLVIGAIVLVAAGGTTAYMFYNQSRNAEVAEETITYETVQAAEGTIRIGVDSFAIVEPIESRTIRSRSPGNVSYIVQTGTLVDEGDEIVRFDASDLESRLRRAEIDLADAQLAYDRAVRSLERAEREWESTQALFDAGVATGEQLSAREESLYQAEFSKESSRLSLERRQLDLETAQTDFDTRIVRAPMAGVITSTAAARGDSVNSNAELLTISDTSRVRLVAEIDEYDIARIAPDMRVQARFDALEWMQAGLGTFNGTLESISPSARIVSNISVFTVTARFNNAEGYIRPGMTADITILTAMASGLLVPAHAVSSVRDRYYVEVEGEDGTVEARRVTIGISDGVHVVVHEGLTDDDQIVVPMALGLDTLSAEPLVRPEPSQSIIPISVPGASSTGGAPSGGGAGGGGGRQ